MILDEESQCFNLASLLKRELPKEFSVEILINLPLSVPILGGPFPTSVIVIGFERCGFKHYHLVNTEDGVRDFLKSVKDRSIFKEAKAWSDEKERSRL